jgi:hypothetical protein
MFYSIREKIVREIGAFARFSLPGPGVTRLPFSDENDRAIEYIIERLRSLGKRVYVDELEMSRVPPKMSFRPARLI